MGGWKTRSVFDGYNVVENQDLRKAARLLEGQGVGNSVDKAKKGLR
jgi:hypothetical protein